MGGNMERLELLSMARWAVWVDTVGGQRDSKAEQDPSLPHRDFMQVCTKQQVLERLLLPLSSKDQVGFAQMSKGREVRPAIWANSGLVYWSFPV